MILRTAFVAFLLACGSSSEPSTEDTSGAEEGRCPTALRECYDEGSRAQCLQVVETCPPQNVVQLRSCPVQYDCQRPASDECAGYSRGDACITEENFAECQRLQAECPDSMIAMESCPLQFACE